jgi:hypothetical protein
MTSPLLDVSVEVPVFETRWFQLEDHVMRILRLSGGA